MLIGESTAFREEGLFTAYVPLLASSSSDSHKLKTAPATATPPSRATSSRESSRSLERTKSSELTTAKHPPNDDAEKSAATHDRPSPLDGTVLASHSSPDLAEPETSKAELDVATSANRRSPASGQASSAERSHCSVPRAKILEHVTSDVDRFKSRLIAVRSEGLSAKETMLKCAGIADDAFRRAVVKLQSAQSLSRVLVHQSRSKMRSGV